MTYILLSIGSNIDRDKNVRYAIRKIAERYGEINLSPVYETSSVGFVGQPFLNLVLGLHSGDDLLQIREYLRGIESDVGRVRGRKSFDNRLLDIDVILFGDKNLRSAGFEIPRHEIEKFAYVLKPLSDLHPKMVHPVTGKTYDRMWQDFSEKSDQLVTLSQFTP